MNEATFDPVLKERLTYKFWVKDHVRFNDLDMLGHVNSVRANEYFAGARTGLFKAAIENWPCSDQLPVLKLSIVQYEKEIRFPSTLDIGLCVEKFGNTSVTVVVAVFDGSACVALSRNVFVFIDQKTRAPVSPHERIKQNFLALAG